MGYPHDSAKEALGQANNDMDTALQVVFLPYIQSRIRRVVYDSYPGVGERVNTPTNDTLLIPTSTK